MSAQAKTPSPIEELDAVMRGIAKIGGKIELGRMARRISPREERRLDQERRSLENRANQIRQDLFLAASFFVAGALDALMNDVERGIYDSASSIEPVSNSTDDSARACFDRGGRRAAARHATYSRVSRPQALNFQTMMEAA